MLAAAYLVRRLPDAVADAVMAERPMAGRVAHTAAVARAIRLWLMSAASSRLCPSCCFWWAKALGGETKISYRPFCPSSGGSLPQDQV